MNLFSKFFLIGLMSVFSTNIVFPKLEDLKIDHGINEEFNNIFNNFLFIEQSPHKNELTNLKLFIDNVTQEQRVKLQELIYWFKVASLNLEALTISSFEFNYSKLEKVFNFVELQQAKVLVLNRLFCDYRMKSAKGQLLVKYFSEKYIKGVLFAILPQRLKKSMLNYLSFGFTQSSKEVYYLGKVLKQNFYTGYPVISEEYLDVISKFYKLQYYGENTDVLNLLSRIDKLINDFVRDRAALNSEELILELLLAKLIKVRNIIVDCYVLALDLADEPEKARLFVKFKLLIESDKFNLLRMDSEFEEIIGLYLSILREYFKGSKTSCELSLKLFELECKLIELRKDKQDIFLKKLIFKKNQVIEVIEGMLGLLNEIKASCFTTEKESEVDLELGIFSEVLDKVGNFKSLKINSIDVFVNFVESLFNRKFDGIKEASFYLLAQTSPVLAAWLIHRILPYLSSELKAKAYEVLEKVNFGESESCDNNSKLFDFISQNPKIFEKLCEAKPGLINGLANVVEQKLNEVKS